MPKAKTVVKRAPPSPASAVSEAQDLTNATEVLFGTTENPLELRDGRKIVVQRGKIAHVGLLLSFFSALVENMSKDDIVTLVQLIEESKAKEAGTPIPRSVEELVGQAFGRSSLLISVFQATFSVLPKIVGALSTVTEKEWQDLDMDEGALVAFTVFQVNYSFFSQNLPQAMRVFLALAGKKLLAS